MGVALSGLWTPANGHHLWRTVHTLSILSSVPKVAVVERLNCIIRGGVSEGHSAQDPSKNFKSFCRLGIRLCRGRGSLPRSRFWIHATLPQKNFWGSVA